MRYTALSTFIVAILAFALAADVSRADVSVIGDTIPNPGSLPDFGGPVPGGQLIIGDETVDTNIIDEGGFFMDNALPLFDPLTSVECDDFIIGNQENTVGAATIEDVIVDDATGFAIPSVIVNNDLIVGNGGDGFLDMFDSASITVAARMTIGLEQSGTGLVAITGQGTRIFTNELVVGDFGFGQLDITNRGVMISGTGNATEAVIGNDDGGIGIVTVTGTGSRWSVGTVSAPNSLVIGNGDAGNTTGQGTLKISAGGSVQVTDDLTVNPLGRIELATEGRLQIVDTTAANTIVNNGAIIGGGYVDFVGNTFTNGPVGQIRNVGGPFGGNVREKLIFTGDEANGDTLTNFGTIESLGGEMEFRVPVVNNLEIVARDAVMRFLFTDVAGGEPAGLQNNPGSVVVVGGDSTLHGTINPLPLSNFRILNDSIVTIEGDLLFTEPFLMTDGEGEVAASGAESATLSIAIGDHPGYLTVTGNLDLTNAELDLDLAGMPAPTIGDIVNLVTVQGDVTGTFVNSSVFVGGQRWDVNYASGSIFATYAGPANVPGDFDVDGDVDGRDFLAWQRNPGVGDLADWQANYNGGSLNAGLSSVPEPSALVLSVLALGLLSASRKRK